MRNLRAPDQTRQYIASHANDSCSPERQKQHFPDDEEGQKAVTLNDYVKSQLYSILK